MGDVQELADYELVELELDLIQRQDVRPPKPLPRGGDVPAEDVEALTTLLLVQQERRKRLIPDIFEKGSDFDVVYSIQTSARSVDVRTDTFSNPSDRDAAKEAALHRAVQLGQAYRKSQM